MRPVLPSEIAPADEQPTVYVQYGKCAGLPPLTGKGKITAEKERHGLHYVYIEPIEGLPFAKWLPLNEVEYIFNQTTEAA